MYNMLLKNFWLMWYLRVMNEGGSFPPSNDLYLPSLPTCRGGGGRHPVMCTGGSSPLTQDGGETHDDRGQGRLHMLIGIRHQFL